MQAKLCKPPMQPMQSKDELVRIAVASGKRLIIIQLPLPTGDSWRAGKVWCSELATNGFQAGQAGTGEHISVKILSVRETHARQGRIGCAFPGFEGVYTKAMRQTAQSRETESSLFSHPMSDSTIPVIATTAPPVDYA